MLKYGPEIIAQEVARILNDIASTGIYPNDIEEGILIPLPKPGKPSGPPENKTNCLILTIIRKILGICLTRRIADRLNDLYRLPKPLIDTVETPQNKSLL